MNKLQLKVCGISEPAHAARCAALGIDAVGLVFYPPSPRAITPQQAEPIIAALRSAPQPQTVPVALFVDRPISEMVAIAEPLGIRHLQLHGSETVEQVAELQRLGYRVIKAIRAEGKNWVQAALRYPEQTALLVESKRGALPGGNGKVWNWEQARRLADHRPFAVAGGITPENACDAARASHASLLDLSSGVEWRSGEKSVEKIEALVVNLQAVQPTWKVEKVI